MNDSGSPMNSKLLSSRPVTVIAFAHYYDILLCGRMTDALLKQLYRYLLSDYPLPPALIHAVMPSHRHRLKDTVGHHLGTVGLLTYSCPGGVRCRFLQPQPPNAIADSRRRRRRRE